MLLDALACNFAGLRVPGDWKIDPGRKSGLKPSGVASFVVAAACSGALRDRLQWPVSQAHSVATSLPPEEHTQVLTCCSTAGSASQTLARCVVGVSTRLFALCIQGAQLSLLQECLLIPTLTLAPNGMPRESEPCLTNGACCGRVLSSLATATWSVAPAIAPQPDQ